MKKGILAILSCYFLLGCMLLPNGDFSLLPEISLMYHQCQATEDKDMNVLDFITDHLINIDGIFDKHDNGDKQKPHTAFHFQTISHISIVQYFPIVAIQVAFTSCLEEKRIFPLEQLCPTDYFDSVFRPPIVC